MTWLLALPVIVLVAGATALVTIADEGCVNREPDGACWLPSTPS